MFMENAISEKILCCLVVCKLIVLGLTESYEINFVHCNNGSKLLLCL